MSKKLPAWLFLVMGIGLLATAYIPVIRALIGIDDQISLSFLSTVTVAIGGMMCALTAMILLARRAQPQEISATGEYSPRLATMAHLSSLLIFTGVPLLNFLVSYGLWQKHRHRSALLDLHLREVINFQITIYLYMLMSLLMAYLLIGVFFLILLAFFQFVMALIAAITATQPRIFRYPASIAIISRELPEAIIDH